MSVNSGITLLEKKTRSVEKEAEQVADRVRQLQERLARLEGETVHLLIKSSKGD